MEIGRLEEQLEMLQTIGFTLTVDEKLRLKVATCTLMEQHTTLDEIKFWGKIQGLTKSYYILVGLRFCKAYEFPHKCFFYAVSPEMEFKELPDLLVQHEGQSQKFNAMPFTGDPARILVNFEGEGQGEGEAPPPAEQEAGQGQGEAKVVDEDEEELKKVPKKNFTELTRLAYVVRAIENDVQCVPKGSYRVTSEHELRPNTHFYGLQVQNARLAQNWLHFRAPQTTEAKNAMESDMVVFGNGFLDQIGQDKPQGSWSLQLDCRHKNVSVRSLLWPGYFAFHRLGTDLFGGVYFGEGRKNIDLPFMI